MKYFFLIFVLCLLFSCQSNENDILLSTYQNGRIVGIIPEKSKSYILSTLNDIQGQKWEFVFAEETKAIGWKLSKTSRKIEENIIDKVENARMNIKEMSKMIKNGDGWFLYEKIDDIVAIKGLYPILHDFVFIDQNKYQIDIDKTYKLIVSMKSRKKDVLLEYFSNDKICGSILLGINEIECEGSIPIIKDYGRYKVFVCNKEFETSNRQFIMSDKGIIDIAELMKKCGLQNYSSLYKAEVIQSRLVINEIKSNYSGTNKEPEKYIIDLNKVLLLSRQKI
jgi:hypothetical protein